mgnify:CR=1 FL=1
MAQHCDKSEYDSLGDIMVSKKPRKQRKRLYKAPLHRRKAALSAHLSEELRVMYKRRALPVRSGDKVEVLRGDFRGHRGSVVRVDLNKMVVYVEGVRRKKVDGSEVNIPLNASNLRILELNLEDPKRKKILDRKVERYEET